MRGPFPDLHKAILIFEIQIAGAKYILPLQDFQKEYSKFRLQANCRGVHSTDLHTAILIFEIQIAGAKHCSSLPDFLNFKINIIGADNFFKCTL